MDQSISRQDLANALKEAGFDVSVTVVDAPYYAAIALKPDDGVLYNNLGISYLLAGKHAAAVEAFEKALEAKNTRRKADKNLHKARSELAAVVSE